MQQLPADQPDVVLMDINMPGMDGIECVKRLKVLAPQLQILMLTVYEDTDRIFKALAAGATGYLLKAEPEIASGYLGCARRWFPDVQLHCPQSGGFLSGRPSGGRKTELAFPA